MRGADPQMLDAAALWVARTRDPSFRDWDGLTAWLEADPLHNDAYELTLDAHDVTGGLGATDAADLGQTVPDAAGRRRLRPVWITAAAATVAAMVAVPTLLPRHDRYTVTTAAGEQRSIRLSDGTTVSLNGGSRLVVDRAHPRALALASGEAEFTVVHDASRPFVVTAGNSRIEDVGTVFNVVRGGGATDVAVSEGAVVYDPAGAQVKLVAGGSLHDPDGGMIEVAQVDPASIGAWRKGRLIYRGAPLSVVAADLSRATGHAIAAAPDVAVRPFSGTIVFRGLSQSQLIERVGALTGTRAVRTGAGWLLASGAGAAR